VAAVARGDAAPWSAGMEPRLKTLGPEDVTDRARAIFDAFLRERGNIPNMFRTLAHVPPLLETAFAHFRAVMAPGAVTPRLKEMVALRVSYRNRCDYCLGSHTKLAAKLGVSQAQMEAIQRGDFSEFDEGDRAALTLADETYADGHGLSDRTSELVRRHFGDAGLVELVAVVGLFHYFNRFNNALRMEVTK